VALSPEQDADLTRLAAAVADLRQRCAEDPSGTAGSLAATLGEWSRLLAVAGRLDEARAAAEDSVAVGRAAMAHDAERGRFILVAALIARAGGHVRDGEPDQAIEGLSEAVTLFRGAGEAGLPFLGGMIEALHQAALAFSELGAWGQAVALRRLIAELFAAPPAAAVHMLVLTLVQGARAAETQATLFPGLAWAEEAVALAVPLAEQDPEGANLLLAQAMGGLAAWRHQAGDDASALRAALDSVELLQGEVPRQPAAVIPTLILVLDTLVEILSALGLTEQAATVREQGAVLRASLDRGAEETAPA